MLDGNGKRVYPAFSHMTDFGPVEVVDVFKSTQGYLKLTHLKGYLPEDGPYNRFARHLAEHARKARIQKVEPEPVSFASWRNEQPEIAAQTKCDVLDTFLRSPALPSDCFDRVLRAVASIELDQIERGEAA